MGLRNVETWILQFTNFLYDVIAPDLTIYILEHHALNACCLLWGSIQNSLWAVWAEQHAS